MTKTEEDVEQSSKKIPYPKSVFFIIVCEFCERFCYYGMRTILTLYFVQVLSWSDDTATVVYHVFVMFTYFTPLLGAMIADSFLGKFQTIFYLSVVYCIGCAVLALSATPPLKIPTAAFSLVGLGLIALGTGGIKPCVSAFGADQFKLPEQEKQVESYFAMFYFAINSGSLISTLLTPILREDVNCFEDDHCYPLAFSVPGALMIVALIIFIAGKPMYTILKPEGNVVLEVIKCISEALSKKKKEIKAGRPREHWLDYAEERFGKRFVAETKVLLKVLFLYIPLPLFWALFDQQGSRWTLQATRMNGNTFGWIIKPDQLQVVNPLLVLLFIPLFDQLLYPYLLNKVGLKSPLRRLATGGILAGVAFVVSGLVELGLERTYAIELKGGESNIHLINGVPNCPVTVSANGLSTIDLQPFEMHIHEAINSGTYDMTFDYGGNPGCPPTLNENVVAEDEVARSFILRRRETGESFLLRIDDEDDLEKADSGNPKMKVVYDGFDSNVLLQGDQESNTFDFLLRSDKTFTDVGELQPTKYDLKIVNASLDNGTILYEQEDVEMKLGAVYVMGVFNDDEGVNVAIHEITEANSVHMLLLLPQYIIMTAGEIMFSITIMDFSYAEGPPSMKSVMQSAWLMTVAFGNLIVVIIAEAKIFDKQWKEFFLFAGLMFGAMGLFSYMAYIYEPTDRFWLRDNQEENKDNNDTSEDKADGSSIRKRGSTRRESDASAIM